jgi:hypothetical protein
MNLRRRTQSIASSEPNVGIGGCTSPQPNHFLLIILIQIAADAPRSPISCVQLSGVLSKTP